MTATPTKDQGSLYTGNDYYGDNYANLVISAALGITANSYGHTYQHDNIVVVMAKLPTGQMAAYVGIATGDTMPQTAGAYWPAYHKPDSVVSRLMPVTRVHVIPADLYTPRRITQAGLAVDERAAIVTHLLTAG